MADGASVLGVGDLTKAREEMQDHGHEMGTDFPSLAGTSGHSPYDASR
jgi:hypothetical protein